MSIVHDTPLGPLHLDASPRGLTLLGFSPAASDEPRDADAERVLDLARREIDAYFAGRLREFTVPVDLHAHPSRSSCHATAWSAPTAASPATRAGWSASAPCSTSRAATSSCSDPLHDDADQ